MAGTPEKSPRLPPRWFIRVAWTGHRAMTGSPAVAAGCGRPSRAWGTMRLTTVGRKPGSGSAILGYFEDGPNLVTLAMNGWGGRAGVVAQPPGASGRGGRTPDRPPCGPGTGGDRR